MLCGLTAATCEDYCGDRPGLCGLHRVAWGTDGDLAAVLTWDDDEARGVLWTNRRIVRGHLCELVNLWAIHRVWTGCCVAVLQRDDLHALPRDMRQAVS